MDSWAPKGALVGLVLLQVNTLLLFFLVTGPLDVKLWGQDGEESNGLPLGGGGGALL